MKIITSRIVYCLILILLLIVGGCNTEKRSNQTDDTIRRQSSFTPTFIKTVIFPTPTNNILTTQVGTRENLASTILPTLTNNESKQLAYTFLETNGGCQFPCLWGLIPREEKSKVDKFLLSFGNHDEEPSFYSNVSLSERWANLFLSFHENDKSITSIIQWDFSNYTFPISSLVISNQTDSGQGLNRQMKALYDSKNFTGVLTKYSLSNILIEYGKPTTLLLYTNHDDPYFPNILVEFSLVLYYDKGFLINYIFPRDVDQNIFFGCPSKSAYINMLFWDPDSDKSLQDILVYNHASNGITKDNFHLYKHLEDVSNQTVDDFYFTMKHPGSDQCITTDAQKWPAIR